MYKIILHATDLSENHFDLCEQAVKFARSIKAQIHFIHVIEQPVSLQIAQSLGFAELANPNKKAVEAVMQVVGEALNVPLSHQHVEIGSTKQQVLNMIKFLGCDLVILGSHSSDGLPAFLGSTAHSIIHHAPCDVLTMRV